MLNTENNKTVSIILNKIVDLNLQTIEEKLMSIVNNIKKGTKIYCVNLTYIESYYQIYTKEYDVSDSDIISLILKSKYVGLYLNEKDIIENPKCHYRLYFNKQQAVNYVDKISYQIFQQQKGQNCNVFV